MKALVVSSGSITDYELLISLAKDIDFVLCADGGLRHLMSINLKPDLIIGDLDSIDEVGKKYINKYHIPIHKFPSEKDETDTELAIIYLMDKGYKDITLTGVTGSRMDHTLANIFLLKRLCKNNIKGKIVDNYNTVYYANDKLVLNRKEGYYTSIIPVTETGVRVTLTGFYYPLKNHLIEFGSSLGVSNRIIDDFGIIDISEGECLVIVSKD